MIHRFSIVNENLVFSRIVCPAQQESLKFAGSDATVPCGKLQIWNDPAAAEQRGSSVTLLKKLGNTMAWDAEKSSKQQGMKSKKSFILIS